MSALTEGAVTRPVGELLRGWRERRRLSQLSLSNSVEVSTRHLSYLETGRAQPSRAMVLRLAEHLDVPLRERNQLLLAAGFAPVYGEASLHSPPMLAVREALRRMLAGHEPYPAMVVDRWFNLVETNAVVRLIFDDVDPELIRPPANALRLCLHPGGLAPMTTNLPEFRAHILRRLERQVEATGDPELVDLLAELRGYPSPGPEHPVPVDLVGDVVMPWRIRYRDVDFAFLSTVATFGTPADITVAELAIELLFPADRETAEALRVLADSLPAPA